VYTCQADQGAWPEVAWVTEGQCPEIHN